MHGVTMKLIFLQFYYTFRLYISVTFKYENWLKKKSKRGEASTYKQWIKSYCTIYDHSKKIIIGNTKINRWSIFEYSFKVQKCIPSINFKVAYYFVFGVIIIKVTITLYSLFVRRVLSPFTLFVNQYTYLILSEINNRNVQTN